MNRGLSRYIWMVDHQTRLDRDRERRLAERYRDQHDEAAGEALLTAHLRLVVIEAHGQKRYGVPLEELIAEGNLGLMHALRKFEPERGNRFATYARYWIRAYMIRHIIKTWSVVTSGAGDLSSRNFFRLRRDRNRLACIYPDPSEVNAQLAVMYGRSETQIAKMLRRLDRHDDSLDATLRRDGRMTRADLLVDERPGLEERTEAQEVQGRLREEVASCVTDLDDRELAILQERLMRDDDERTTLAEIGTRFGLSRERVRQIQDRLELKLRRRLIALARRTRGELFELN